MELDCFAGDKWFGEDLCTTAWAHHDFKFLERIRMIGLRVGGCGKDNTGITGILSPLIYSSRMSQVINQKLSVEKRARGYLTSNIIFFQTE
jgi:hypothetical protein